MCFQAGMLKRLRTPVILLLLVLFPVVTGASFSAATAVEPTKKVAFVIDDFGNNMSGTEEIMNLPIPLTIAVMPFLPTTKRDAEWAHRKHHDVFVHLPMEPRKGKKSWLGPGAILTDLSDEEIRRRVIAAIEDVPYAIGINNHMGSKATADPRVMRVILQICRERGLYFLDSRTTDRSVAGKIAAELGVPYLENQLFLDDIYSVQHISKQMRLLCKRIAVQDTAIAIGHVGPPGKKTASVLRTYIPIVNSMAQVVKISQLIHK
ncbi:divergent polysaccharide deacetylase family protein [Brevibacillus sp. SYP-B805]|uniref:divergent polysaccharide deacetylase family protein n=1 Tax=Brevibacillus sp. SYP-B805 TaxID=1578199 RepID=UPI001F49A8DF|nr:divergent polysaccharide deacetylase family protein [Brevibacillus sp. SYP-B805]